MAQLARFEAGQVHLPENAPWLSCYVNELLSFPYGKHDDQVDATSQALENQASRIAESPASKLTEIRAEDFD